MPEAEKRQNTGRWLLDLDGRQEGEMSATRLLNFWFSAKQNAIDLPDEDSFIYRNFVTIAGKEFLYSEAGEQDKPSGRWDDCRFLGKAPEDAIRTECVR